MNNIGKIRKINDEYKKSVDKNLKINNFCPFRYEKQMDYLFPLLVKNVNKYTNGYKPKILDIACGYGRLIYFIKELNMTCEIWGIDYVARLINLAKKNFKDSKNIKFRSGNLYDLSRDYKKFFDIVISYKTLSWLPDYKDAVKEMMSAATDRVYITSLFYNGNMSFETKINELNKKTYTYLNTYSLNEFKSFCKKNGAKKVIAHEIYIDFDLPKPEDPDILKTFTIKTADKKRLEVTGNVILNWKLIEIILK